MKLKTWKRLEKAGVKNKVLRVQLEVPALMLGIQLQHGGATFEEAIKRVENLAIQWALGGWTYEEMKTGYQRQYWKMCGKER